MTQQDDYLARAAECDRLAHEAPNPAVRIEWEQMGAWFRLMAHDIDEKRQLKVRRPVPQSNRIHPAINRDNSGEDRLRADVREVPAG
jgi:hypothetical protein